MSKALSRLKNLQNYDWMMAVAIFAALIHFGVVLFIVLSRINYRYELEWMEGASLIQVYRIYTGQSLYIQPSLEYIPLIYPPLYFYLAAALFKIMGISFLPLRLISFGSTVGCLLVIYYAVKDTTNSAWIGLVAAGSFVATFKLGGAWFDIARVDMLFLFLCLAAIYLLGKQTVVNSMFAGILFALAFLAKQTALPIFLVSAGATVLLFRKQALPFIASFAVLALVTYFYLNSSTRGWYQYYILALPAMHQIKWATTLATLQSGFSVEAIIIMVGLSPLLFGARHLLTDKMHQYYYLVVIGIIATSVLARINRGAYINTLVPAYAGLAVLFGLGMGWLGSRDNYPRINKNLFRSLLWLAITAQFALLVYDPTQQIPTEADRRAGDALVSDLQKAPGDVLIPYHNYLSLFAGKKVNFHMVTFDEIRGTYSKKQPEFKEVMAEFRATPFSLLIMDVPDKVIQKNHCADTQTIDYESTTTFYPVTGYSVRPTILNSDCP